MALDASTRRALAALTAPGSVAIVGASTDPAKLSSKPLVNLRARGFEGPVYPVNPRAREIDGLPCYSHVGDLPTRPDLAFVVLPAEQAVEAAWQCARLDVPAVVIAVSGFAEVGTADGAALENELTRIGRETATRVLGPNCNGLYNARLGISLGYNAAHAEAIPAGALSVISHSGALFSTLSGRARRLDLGFGVFVSVGNEADLGLLDIFEWVVEDETTRVIGLIVESIRDGARFREIASAASARGKRVVALKLGLSEIGRAATAAHSSRLAGSAQAYEALLSQSGVARVTTPEGLVTAAALLAENSIVRGSGLGALTTTGAGGAILADAAARSGVGVAEVGLQTRAALDRYRRFAPVLNPVDLGATGTEATAEIAASLAADSEVGALVLYATALLREQSRVNVARGFCAARAASKKPAVVLSPGGLSDQEERTYRQAGIPVLHDTAVCFEGLSAVLTCRHSGRAPLRDAVLPHDVAEILGRRRPFNEPESLEVMRAAGLPVVESRMVPDAREAVCVAEVLGWPVVLKGVSRGVPHKSDIGLVLLEVDGRGSLEAGVRTIQARARSAGVKLEGLLVQPMRRGRIEAFIGVAREHGVGAVLVAGLGGVFAEALRETVTWVLPVTEAEIDSKLDQAALGRVLRSPRYGLAKAKSDLVQALLRLQDLVLASGDALEAIDVNPLLLGDEGAVALDALVIPRSVSGSAASP